MTISTIEQKRQLTWHVSDVVQDAQNAVTPDAVVGHQIYGLAQVGESL